MFEVTPETWLISDTHFGHDNIIKYCNRPVAHNELMTLRWMRTVKPDDVVLHLGDVWFGRATDPAHWAEVIARLPGQKKLILGNHDKSPKHFYTDAGFEILKPFVQDGIAFTHCPISELLAEMRPKYVPQAVLEGEEWHTNVHGHIHNNGYTQGERIRGKKYINISVEQTDYRPIRLSDLALG